MAISTTMVVDNIANVAIGTVLVNGVFLEELTFNNSTNLVELAERADMVISKEDLISLLKFYIIFNNAVIASFFPVSQFQYTPFSNIDQQLENNGVDTLSFTFQFQPTDPLPLFQFICTYPSGDVYVQKRTPADSISYAQFLYFLYQAANFRTFVLNAYNL